MQPVLPPQLKEGDTIAVVSPSFAVCEAVVEPVLRTFLASYGLRLRLYEAEPSTQQLPLQPEAEGLPPHRMAALAGSDAWRLKQLQAALASPNVQAVWLMRGGYGLSRLLPQLQLGPLLAQPKWVIGYSDATLLLGALLRQGMACVHGPMASAVLQPCAGLAQLFPLLMGGLGLPQLLGGHAPQQLPRAGLVGGNLSMLAHAVGSPFLPDLKGRLVLLEEVGEKSYAIDRMLWQLRHAGLGQAAGLLLGHFSQVQEYGVAGSAHGLLQAHAQQCGLPWARVAAGHQAPNHPLVLGLPTQVLPVPGGLQLVQQLA